MSLRVLLVDDEPLALQRLSRALEAFGDVQVVGRARDGDAGLAEARRLVPDLVVLDIEMPGLGGLALAARVEREGLGEIVFHSAFDRYAAAAFEVEAVDYLLKPLRPERLRQAIDRARRRRAAKAALAPPPDPAAAPSLHVPDRHGGRDVAVGEIVWIEAARDYALIHTAVRSHMLRATMAELAAQLPPTIRRVHRSALVALAQVRRWEIRPRGGRGLVLSDGTTVSVGPSYLEETRAALRALES